LGYGLPGRKVPNSLRFKRYHWTTKVGPNKPGNALWNSLTDLYGLPETLLESIKIVGGPKLANNIENLIKGRKLLAPVLKTVTNDYSFRRLSSFPDKELKVRVIGILDYFSQTSLKPLHLYLFRVLRKIGQDCTFNQGAFKDDAKFLAGDIFYSYDLSQATDRFPIKFIASVLKGRLSPRYVHHWINIMVGYPFDTPEGNKISYSVGNPMGAYSS